VTVAARLAAFSAVLVVVLLAGLGLGRAVGPVGSDAETDAAPRSAEEPPGHEDAAEAHDEASEDGAASAVTGLAVSEDGYTLQPTATTLPLGRSELRFRISGPDGAAVTALDLTHERELHLVVVHRDGSGFQHLHPERTPDGTWSTPLTLDRAGAYRAYTDFAPAGQAARTLAVDLLVPGELVPQEWPAPSATTSVSGYDVRLDGHLDAGEQSELIFTVTRDGEPVQLERYLGAAGHLVVLREGDLGYLHVHADGEQLAFSTTAPSAGRYRLFLQVQVDGVVHTAELTAEAEEAHA
jgi:hypothetical protein